MNNFVHLNTKSRGSFLFASCDIEKLILKAKEFGHNSLALTDYGNLFNSIKFYKFAIKNNIKPILGCTLYLCQDIKELKQQKIRKIDHITFLAENQIGWKNLIRLVSEAHREENFYFFPRIDFQLLEKYKEGLIVLTGNTRDSIITNNLFDKLDNLGNIKEKITLFKTEALIRKLLNIFDRDHLYLEVQNNGDFVQKQANEQLRLLATKYSLKTIATNNIHYIDQKEAEAHKTLLKMNISEYGKITFSNFNLDEYHFKSRSEMIGFTEEELNLTQEIADRCNVVIDLKKHRLPKYKFLPEGNTAINYLRKLVHNGLSTISLSKEYIDRAERELKDIEDMGFADYFLIVQDVLNWCRQQNMLLSPSRGSVGGSICAYALGITEVDPLKYNLIWERFLNKGRGGLPDIDSDVPRSRRQEVLTYIKERFGNVAQLITFNGLQARAILKEVFRVFDMPFDEANKITNLLPTKNDEHTQISLDEAIKAVPELQIYEKKYKAWFEIARSLEGCYKNSGIHPAAVIISDISFDEGEYSLARSKDGNILFGWDMESVDDLHLLKLDILGISTLDDIQESFKLINERYKINLNRKSIPLDDIKTFDLLAKGRTVGVFQLETQLGRNWSKKVAPSSIEEIADLTSILRPGAMDSKMSENYVNKKKINDRTPIHPLLADVTYDSYGEPIYQENFITACQKLAKMNLIDSDSVRAAVGKKKADELKKWKIKFIDGCLINNIKKQDAEDIWEKFEKFAGYSFNRAHAISYSLLTYETAYLKANYPVEFFCAKLKTAKDHPEKFERINSLVYDAKLFDIKILPPRNTLDFNILNNKEITFGLSSIKGIGKGTAKIIINLLNQIKTFDEFILQSNGISSSAMEGLIKSGTLDIFKLDRIRMWSKYCLMRELSEKELQLIKPNTDWVSTLNDLTKDNAKEKFNIKRAPDSRRKIKINEIINNYLANDLFDNLVQNAKWEQEFLGISLTSHTLTNFKGYDKCINLAQSAIEGDNFDIIVEINSIRQIITKDGNPMAFISAKDESYSLESIVIFPKIYEKSKNILNKEYIIRIRGRVDQQGSFIANKLERIK